MLVTIHARRGGSTRRETGGNLLNSTAWRGASCLWATSNVALSQHPHAGRTACAGRTGAGRATGATRPVIPTQPADDPALGLDPT